MTSLAHNIQNDTRFEDMIKRASQLGRDSVKSALSKPNLALELVRGIMDQVLDDDDKINAHFDAYLAARAKETAKNVLTHGLAEDNENSIKANRSKQMQLAKLAALPAIDAAALLDEVTDRREQLLLGGVKVKPAYDSFVDVARAQLKQPLEQLDGDTLDKLISKPEPKDKDTLAKLTEQYKRTYRLAEQMGDEMLDCTYIEAARDSLADAIRALDGELPSMTKEQKKEDEIVAFLIKNGFSKEVARNAAKGK